MKQIATYILQEIGAQPCPVHWCVAGSWSGLLGVVARRYILQQKCLNGQI